MRRAAQALILLGILAVAGCGRAAVPIRQSVPTIAHPSVKFAVKVGAVCAAATVGLRKAQNVPAPIGFPINTIVSVLQRQYRALRALRPPANERAVFASLLEASREELLAAARMVLFADGVQEIHDALFVPSEKRFALLANRLGAGACAGERDRAEDLFLVFTIP